MIIYLDADATWSQQANDVRLDEQHKHTYTYCIAIWLWVEA